jgi:hypothetical protein
MVRRGRVCGARPPSRFAFGSGPNETSMTISDDSGRDVIEGQRLSLDGLAL